MLLSLPQATEREEDVRDSLWATWRREQCMKSRWELDVCKGTLSLNSIHFSGNAKSARKGKIFYENTRFLSRNVGFWKYVIVGAICKIGYSNYGQSVSLLHKVLLKIFIVQKVSFLLKQPSYV
jgi:hypothetical protein